MDMNPFAVSPNTPQQPGQMAAPATAGGPNLNNGSMAGGVGAMVKALMDGNDQYKQRQSLMGNQQGTPGAPMSLAAPQDPTSSINPTQMASAGPMAPMTPPPQQAMPTFPTGGAPPVGVDPMTQALFSPIPGMYNG